MGSGVAVGKAHRHAIEKKEMKRLNDAEKELMLSVL